MVPYLAPLSNECSSSTNLNAERSKIWVQTMGQPAKISWMYLGANSHENPCTIRGTNLFIGRAVAKLGCRGWDRDADGSASTAACRSGERTGTPPSRAPMAGSAVCMESFMTVKRALHTTKKRVDVPPFFKVRWKAHPHPPKKCRYYCSDSCTPKTDFQEGELP